MQYNKLYEILLPKNNYYYKRYFKDNQENLNMNKIIDYHNKS